MQTRIEIMRSVVSEGAKKIRIDGRKVLIDSFTAGAVCQVHDGLNAENQAKFMALPFLRMVKVTWQLVKSQAVH